MLVYMIIDNIYIRNINDVICINLYICIYIYFVIILFYIVEILLGLYSY